MSKSSGTYSVSSQITDGTGYVVKSTPSTITVKTDPVVSSYTSTGESTNFFLFNNTAQSSVDVSGGTPPYAYNWYLNGFKIAQTSEPFCAYTFSSMGPNLLQVNVSDASGFNLAFETATVTFGIDFLHIGVVVAIVVVALVLTIARLGKGRGLKTAPTENQEPTSAQPQAPQSSTPPLRNGPRETLYRHLITCAHNAADPGLFLARTRLAEFISSFEAPELPPSQPAPWPC